MHKIILWTAAIAGLIAGTSVVASASPAVHLLDRGRIPQATNAEPVYYYYNHHRYNHRSWDKRHGRWHYY